MLQIDSRKVKDGDTFIALKGVNNDGHDFILDAISNGADKIIAEHGLYSVDTYIVKDTFEYLKNYLKEIDLSSLKLIGITGTNGKTTSCYLLYHLLNEIGVKTAYIGTLGFYLEEKVKDLKNTTPSIIDIYEMLNECILNKYQYVVMEVSSHALEQDRAVGLNFEYGVFTNLTQDHLDYHKTMENYALSKQKLMTKSVKTIVNIDDEYKDYFLLENSITYGFAKSNYQIKEYETNMDGTTFKINDKTYKTNLIGKHNIYNILISIIVLEDLKKEIPSLEKLPFPKGRMEIIEYETNKIIIDYAHTPDAVRNIVTAIKELKPNNIYTIIGCGGDRDATKRPIMASIATTYSDYVIFTSDNPRHEDPLLILDDMIKDLENENYEVVINRQEAIQKGIQKLEKNDILLVLGKGHENYQIIGDEYYHFDDSEEVLKYL